MLTSEIVQKVKQIQIRTGRQVADVLAGEYLSVFKGRGMEFDEVRPYVPGDDVRTIDWNVTARMGAPYVKRYVEERELTVLLLVDISASQEFGSGERSKREAAAELSALLAFSANQNDDKVGLLLFHGEAEAYIPPRKGQRHVLRVVREVLSRSMGVRPEREPIWKRLPRAVMRRFQRLRELTSGGASNADEARARRATNIRYALEFCQRVISRRAVIFLISDFIDEAWSETLRRVNRRHDVIAVLVTDPRELEHAPAGLITLEDAETGDRRVVDTSSRAFRKAAASESEARIQQLEHELRRSGIDLVHVDAGESVVDPLVEWFRMRQRRIRR